MQVRVYAGASSKCKGIFHVLLPRVFGVMSLRYGIDLEPQERLDPRSASRRPRQALGD